MIFRGASRPLGRRPTKVGLHIIRPDQISGPNIANYRLAASALGDEVDFRFITQTRLAGGHPSVAVMAELWMQLRAFRPDIVHLSGLQTAGFHAVVAARFAGRHRIVMAIHGSSRDALGLSRWRAIAYSFVEWLTLLLVDGFYTVSEHAQHQKFLRRHARKNLGVVHNAAPAIPFNLAEQRDETRAKFSIDENRFVVAVVGRMIYDKGLSFISEAIGRLSDPSVTFLFIGDGPYLGQLREDHVEDIESGRIRLLGKRSDVLELLAGSDMLLFASLHENLPIALLDAMAVGLPIVASDVGGVSEVVRHRYSGELIPARSVDAIVDRVEAFRSDKELTSRYSSGALDLVHRSFSISAQESRVRTIYEKLRKV